MEYRGGFVGNPVPGIHPIVMSFDFNSLYPSIMRAYNLCYTTLVPLLYLDEYDKEDLHKIEIDGGHVLFRKRSMLEKVITNFSRKFS